MAVTASRTRYLLYYAQQRNCLPYAYGGSFTPDPSKSTDCSGLIFSAAALLVGLDPNRRYGSTETLRLARLNRVAAPCGLMPANSKADVPVDAALKVGVMHGGGGPDSHTACTFRTDGVAYNWESRGYPGVLLNQCGPEIARAWDNPIFTDFWYLPAASLQDNPLLFPLPQGFYYGPQEGPSESIAGKSGEPKVWLDRLAMWQAKAGDVARGTYEDSTAKAARKVQNAFGLMPTGFVDQKTWDAVMGGTPVTDPNAPLTNAEWREILDGIRYLRDQVGAATRPDQAAWPSLGTNDKGEKLTLRDAIADSRRKAGYIK